MDVTDYEEKAVINDAAASQGNTDYVEEKETKKRRIGQWYIDKTLGKGGYSWVKMGIDVKTNKRYALKFMERKKDATGKLRKSQIKQVETEISVLRSIGKNAQIIKLIAYNLNQKYPDKNGKDRAVILLVLEYCPGGELFDLLYYTSHLEAILARTYFHQLCDGIAHLHRHGIIHRDIKPQNLLLDNGYNLKITDFGLSKICKISAVDHISNVKLSNPRVGTRGYQAPEIVNMNNILQNGADLTSMGLYYTYKCDIFSMGVVLFILMTGYPPFKCADITDKWYGHIANGNYQSFWKLHRKCGLKKYETDLITKMLFYDSDKRITMEKMQNHKWYKHEILSNKILTQIVAIRHEKTQKLIRTDTNKQAILQYSEQLTRRPILEKYKNRILSAGKTLNAQPPIFNERPNVMHCIYTTVYAYEVLQEIKQVIEEHMKGVLCHTACDAYEIFEDDADDRKEEEADIDIDNFCLTATIAYLKDVDLEETKINVQLYYDNIKQCNLVYFHIIDDNTDKFREIDKWINLKNIFLTKAAHVLTGLPETYKQQKGIEADKDIEELYKKCFPDRLNKKE